MNFALSLSQPLRSGILIKAFVFPMLLIITFIIRMKRRSWKLNRLNCCPIIIRSWKEEEKDERKNEEKVVCVVCKYLAQFCYHCYERYFKWVFSYLQTRREWIKKNLYNFTCETYSKREVKKVTMLYIYCKILLSLFQMVFSSTSSSNVFFFHLKVSTYQKSHNSDGRLSTIAFNEPISKRFLMRVKYLFSMSSTPKENEEKNK